MRADIWKAYNLDTCVHLETLVLKLREYDDAAREQQDEVSAEAYASVISFASTTLRELTLDLFATEELAAFERTAPRIAPLITAAIARFERVVLVVKKFLNFDKYRAILRKYIPTDVMNDDMLKLVIVLSRPSLMLLLSLDAYQSQRSSNHPILRYLRIVSFRYTRSVTRYACHLTIPF